MEMVRWNHDGYFIFMDMTTLTADSLKSKDYFAQELSQDHINSNELKVDTIVTLKSTSIHLGIDIFILY